MLSTREEGDFVVGPEDLAWNCRVAHASSL
jgi:hypothetical protein